MIRFQVILLLVVCSSFIPEVSSITVREWLRREVHQNARVEEDRERERTQRGETAERREQPILPRFETNRELFLDDDYLPYRLGYREQNYWVEKIFNKYASKKADPGTHSLDFGRHKYDPKPRPYVS